MKKQILKVGFDLDGVLLYNPARIARPIIVFMKKIFLKKEADRFHYPKTKIQKLIWLIFHKVVFGPALGYDELKKLIKSKKIKAYIITGRNESLKKDFEKWLVKLEANKYFSGSYFNDKNEQPFLFKERMIRKLKLDLYVEDNWDIVFYLNSILNKSEQNLRIKIYWIYNIFDRLKKFPNKFPGLDSVIKKINKIIE
jgi:hypothetical protein